MNVRQASSKTQKRNAASEQAFVRLVDEHGSALEMYCRFLTGSSWEAKDLLQETWLKIWTSFKTGRTTEAINRSYIRRTAYHAWIDRCRRQQSEVSLKGVAELFQTDEDNVDLFSLWSAMELLLNHLTPNQRGAIMLVDVYRYTAAEAAEMLHMTEGAVKACLFRARQKLKAVHRKKASASLSSNSNSSSNSSDLADLSHRSVLDNETGSEVSESTVYAYLQAFKHHNIAALLMLLNDRAPLDVLPAVQSLKLPEVGDSFDVFRDAFRNDCLMKNNVKSGAKGLMQFQVA